MTSEEMRARVAAARVARLATVNADGTPHLVPIVFALDGDTLITAVDGKPKRGGRLRRIENLRRDPRASVLIDHYEEGWDGLWWVRLDGRARLIGPGDDLDRARALLAGKYPQYARVAIGDTAILIDVERWTGWTGAP